MINKRVYIAAVAIVLVIAVTVALGGRGKSPTRPFHRTTSSRPPASSRCALYASNNGSDSNVGTPAAPVATIKGLILKLRAGEVGCLMADQTFSGDFTLHAGDSHGRPGAPVTIRSADFSHPATIAGRIVTDRGADWLTVTHLKLSYSSASGLPSPTVGSAHTAWTFDDVSGGRNTICFNTVNDATYGVATDTLIDHSRIHDCGAPYSAYEDPNGGYHAHGIYDLGVRTTVTNDYIYDNSSKGVVLRGASGGVVEHNIIDGNGDGVGFGDLGPVNDTVAYNIITNSHSPCGDLHPPGCGDYGVFAYHVESNAGNRFEHNILFGNQQGPYGPTEGLAVADNQIIDPRYVNRAAKDFRLQPGSPAAGYGPVTAQSR